MINSLNCLTWLQEVRQKVRQRKGGLIGFILYNLPILPNLPILYIHMEMCNKEFILLCIIKYTCMLKTGKTGKTWRKYQLSR